MTSPDTNVPWQGLNHLALITNDMDTTVRFWHGVMGAPLIATIGTDTFRHYFFRFGESSSVAFFQYVGHDSKMIITGDTSQVDLPANTKSGLVDAMEKLRGIKGIGTVELERSDIVRHRLVQNIVNAYEKK